MTYLRVGVRTECRHAARCPAHAGPGPREPPLSLKDRCQPLRGNARTHPRWKDFGLGSGLTVLARLLQQVGQGPVGRALRVEVLGPRCSPRWVLRASSASLCCVRRRRRRWMLRGSEQSGRARRRPAATAPGPGLQAQQAPSPSRLRSGEWLSHGPAGPAPVCVLDSSTV